MTISFPTKEAHIAALYDACALIVNTYRETDLLDSVCVDDGCEDLLTAYRFHKFAKEVLNQISNGGIQ